MYCRVKNGHKLCSVCGELKPVSEYYLNASRHNGIAGGPCKKCYTERYKKPRPQRETKTSLEVFARKQLEHYVRTGKIVRPTTCAGCGGGDLPLEGHHEEYTKPLEAIWLCNLCHHGLHNVRKKHPGLVLQDVLAYLKQSADALKDPELKRCSKCLGVKGIGEFFPCNKSHDGMSSACRECTYKQRSRQNGTGGEGC